MKRDADKLKSDEFDLLVIGGGINGAGIARDASQRGLKVALVEKDDFASGTSGNTTKLIHGGIRYLEQLNFHLVRESLRERSIILKLAPHLVKPLQFIIPVYKNDPRPLSLIRLGTTLYDFLAGKAKIKPHQILNADQIFKLEDALKGEGLVGGALYCDAQVDDVRYCLENIISAAEYGTTVVNRCGVIGFIKEAGVLMAVKVYDSIAKETFVIKAKVIVNATGPWTNYTLKLENPTAEPLIRPTKGIHIVYPKLMKNNAIVLSAHRDKRVFFIIPWRGMSIIGTTDTDYSGLPDNVSADEEDISYLLNEASRVLPNVKFSPTHIIGTYAALRPLIKEEGKAAWLVSRDHIIVESGSGLISVAGGKYTTYRLLSEQVVDRVAKRLFPRMFACCKTAKVPLPGADLPIPQASTLALKFGVEEDVVENLIRIYGSRAVEVLKLTRKEPHLKERICPSHLHIKAQVRYAIQDEMALTLSDIQMRRLQTTLSPCRGLDCKAAILSCGNLLRD
ncbi:MAG: glycerol-3-phosphate dehydrogenase [Candidatus Omnitrophota bacterium]